MRKWIDYNSDELLNLTKDEIETLWNNPENDNHPEEYPTEYMLEHKILYPNM